MVLENKMNIRIVVCIVAAAVMAAGCGSKKDSSGPELDAIKAYAKAEVTIERLRKQKAPDWDAIGAQYEITSAAVKRIDAKHGTDYDGEIRRALKKIASGERVKVNQQVLAKGLQHVTVLAIMQELDSMVKSDSAGRRGGALRVAAYFEGIRPTFVRRDADFFAESRLLEKTADVAIKGLSSGDSASFVTARRELEDILARTYSLCVLYEVMEVERLRGSDLGGCDVKRSEAVIFYRIVQARIRKRSAKADEVIRNMLDGSYDTMDSKVLESNLQAGLGGVVLR